MSGGRSETRGQVGTPALRECSFQLQRDDGCAAAAPLRRLAVGVVDLLAARAPGLLKTLRDHDPDSVLLDGTLAECDRVGDGRTDYTLAWFGLLGFHEVAFSNGWWMLLARVCISPVMLWGPIVLALAYAYHRRRRAVRLPRARPAWM